MTDDGSVSAMYNNDNYKTDFEVEANSEVTFTSDKFFRICCGNEELQSAVFEPGTQNFSLNTTINSHTKVIDQTLKEGQVIRLNEELTVWNNERHNNGTFNSGSSAANYEDWTRLDTQLQTYDGKYMTNNGSPIADITNDEYKKGIGLYVISGNGTASSPYTFGENVKYIYTGDNSPMTGGLNNLHTGDVLYKEDSNGNTLEINVTSITNVNIRLTSNKKFYVRKAGRPNYDESEPDTSTGLWYLYSTARIDDISLYDTEMDSGFKGKYLSLNGDIGVKACFYFTNVEALSPNTSVSITVGNKQPVTYSVKDAKLETVKDMQGKYYNVYSFEVTVAAKEMTDAITVIWTDAAGTVHKDIDPFTVKDTAAEYIKSGSEKEKNAAVAMLVYGGYAQDYFGSGEYNNLAYTADGVDKDAINNVNTADLESYAYHPEWTTLPDGVTFTSVSLSLNTNTALNIFLNNDTDSDLTVSAEIDGTAVRDDKINITKNGKKVKVSIKGIPAEMLDSNIKLYVSASTGEGSLVYNNMTYAYNAVKNNYRESDLMKAFYQYHLACAALVKGDN